MFQGPRRLGASLEILPRDGDSGHAERDQERRRGIRRSRHDHNRFYLRPLRAHTGAFVSCALPTYQDAAADIRRYGVRGLSQRTQADQTLGERQQEFREHGVMRDVRGRCVCLRRVHCHVP